MRCEKAWVPLETGPELPAVKVVTNFGNIYILPRDCHVLSVRQRYEKLRVALRIPRTRLAYECAWWPHKDAPTPYTAGAAVGMYVDTSIIKIGEKDWLVDRIQQEYPRARRRGCNTLYIPGLAVASTADYVYNDRSIQETFWRGYRDSHTYKRPVLPERQFVHNALEREMVIAMGGCISQASRRCWPGGHTQYITVLVETDEKWNWVLPEQPIIYGGIAISR